MGRLPLAVGINICALDVDADVTDLDAGTDLPRRELLGVRAEVCDDDE